MLDQRNGAHQRASQPIVQILGNAQPLLQARVAQSQVVLSLQSLAQVIAGLGDREAENRD